MPRALRAALAACAGLLVGACSPQSPTMMSDVAADVPAEATAMDAGEVQDAAHDGDATTAADASSEAATDACTGDCAPDPCAAFGATCGGCTSQSHCGFCRNGAGCHSGTSTGPNDSSCGTSDWAWVQSDCDPCLSHTDCGGCLADMRCGWCGASSACMAGGVGGPGPNGNCTEFWYYGTSTNCPGPPSSYGTCSSCAIAAPAYGWCNGDMTCVMSNPSGSAPADGSTCAGGFTSNWGDCADPCFQHNDCGTCASVSGCGWCQYDTNTTNGACLSSSGNGGPANGASCVHWTSGTSC